MDKNDGFTVYDYSTDLTAGLRHGSLTPEPPDSAHRRADFHHEFEGLLLHTSKSASGPLGLLHLVRVKAVAGRSPINFANSPHRAVRAPGASPSPAVTSPAYVVH